MKFKLGDVVCLKSGGPDMTVFEITIDGYVTCQWFREWDQPREWTFEPEMLNYTPNNPDDVDGFYEVDADENELSDEELDSLVAQSEYYKHHGN
jgi:uncharacterized protein YodC (DUF2158 family)